jgi:GNAT superfamily N-acetyltransferase
MNGVAERIDLASTHPPTCGISLMHQLRPHLADAAELVTRWRRQTGDGYHLVGLWDDGSWWRWPAIASPRTCLRPYCYVDDLVTDAARSGGYGQQLMDWLKAEAPRRMRAAGARHPADNVLGHRFYYRNGLLARALRFNYID